MPAGPGPDVPQGPTVDQRMQALAVRTIPPVFLGLGVVYLAGAPLLPFTLPTAYGPLLAVACALVGLLLIWFSRQAKAGRLPPRHLETMAALLLAAISTQALLYDLLLPKEPTTPTIFMLVAGVGLVVVRRALYYPLAALILLEWGALPFLGHPVDNLQAHWSSLATIALVGLVGNHLRSRSLRHDAEAEVNHEAQGRALQTALQEAREAAQTLKVFNAATTEGIVIHRDGKLVEANDAFWNMFRLPRGGIPNSTMADRVAPASQELVARRMREHLEGPAEIEMVRGDGTIFPAEVEARNIEHGGAPARLAIVRDLTLRRAEERKFRELLESAPDAIVLVDQAGKISLVNAQAESLFGRSRAQLLGLASTELVPERLRPLLAQAQRNAMQGLPLPPLGALGLRGLRADGSEFPVEINVRPIQTAEGPLLAAAIRDTTSRRKAEEADRLAFERLLEIQQLRRLDEFKTGFLNTASHELNTPITPVRLQLHLLKAGQFGPLTEGQAHSVDVIDRNVARLAALVQDLLDVARLQGGQLRLQRARTDLQRLAQEAADAYGPPAAAAGVQLHVREGPPRPLEADARRLAQVFLNFLSNAVKFTPSGGRIDIEVEDVQEGGAGPAALRVTVRDSGAGLSEPQIARLFQPFSQVHEDPALRHAGTGLGLYICRGIVEAHGGRIWADSQGPGKGSSFRFELPKEGPVRPEGSGDGDASPQGQPTEAGPGQAA